MEISEISYTTEISKRYVDELRACEDTAALLAFVNKWKKLAYDAYKSVWSPSFNWEEFKAGLTQETAGQFAGEAWGKKYGMILLPELLLHIGLTAQHFKAPEGAAFIRLREMQMIKKRRKNGIFYLVKPKQEAKNE